MTHTQLEREKRSEIQHRCDGRKTTDKASQLVSDVQTGERKGAKTQEEGGLQSRQERHHSAPRYRVGGADPGGGKKHHPGNFKKEKLDRDEDRGSAEVARVQLQQEGRATGVPWLQNPGRARGAQCSPSLWEQAESGPGGLGSSWEAPVRRKGPGAHTKPADRAARTPRLPLQELGTDPHLTEVLLARL